MNFLSVLLEKSVTFSGSGSEVVEQAATQAANTAASAAPAGQAASGGTMSWIVMVLYVVVIFGLMYFIAIKPQKKREKELQDMQNELKVGDWIMTSSGFYGKIMEIYDKNVVVEFGLNKGIRIPVAKSEIYGNTEPNLSNKPQEDEEKK